MGLTVQNAEFGGKYFEYVKYAAFYKIELRTLTNLKENSFVHSFHSVHSVHEKARCFPMTFQ